MDLKAFASAPKKGKAKKALNPLYIEFLTFVESQGLRFDYMGNTRLANVLGHVSDGAVEAGVTNAGTGLLKHLPLKVQYACCKKNGTYSDSAREKWAAQPTNEQFATLLTQPVIAGKQLVEAFEGWKAEKDAE